MAEENIDLDLLISYPLMKVKTIENKKYFNGPLCVQGKNYEIIVTQNANHEIIMRVTNDLKEFGLEIMKLNNAKINNILQFLDSLKSLIAKNNPLIVDNTITYTRVLDEYCEFTRFYINMKSCSLSNDLMKISVTTEDASKRQHSIEFGVDYQEAKDIFHISKFDFPLHKNQEFKKSCGLLDLYDQILVHLDTLQSYFEVMDIIDANCSVLDPQKPMRKDNYRRIWLGENVCVIITVDPYNVTERPEMIFLGPERLVDKYRTTLNENLEEWNRNGDYFQEMLNILGIEYFPRKPQMLERADLLRDDGECSICFSLQSNGKLPEVVCNNECCENYYHINCLSEWLMSINAKRIFNELHGKCPNCEKLRNVRSDLLVHGLHHPCSPVQREVCQHLRHSKT